MLDAAEALLFGRSNQLPVNQRRRAGIAMIGVDS
jgi:hypothetical protein